jgi:hypothetical protein
LKYGVVSILIRKNPWLANIKKVFISETTITEYEFRYNVR